jgi:hypothetical protein
MTTFLLSDQLQAATDKLGVGLPRLLPQVLESRLVLIAQTRVNVVFHS